MRLDVLVLHHKGMFAERVDIEGDEFVAPLMPGVVVLFRRTTPTRGDWMRW